MTTPSNSRKFILLEGNIAAGKSTLGNKLKESGLFDFIPEPVSAWQTQFEDNLLELFYADTARWAFSFQVATFITRPKTWAEVDAFSDHRQVISERSIYCDRHVFVEACHDNGLMTPSEYQLYVQMWDFATQTYCLQPDAILYLRTPAEICMERLKNRGRGEEKAVTLDYLQQLEDLHDRWLLDNAIVLDGTHHWSAEDVMAQFEAQSAAP